MSEEKNDEKMEIEENPIIEPEKIAENIQDEKTEEKKSKDQKEKKKIVKRAPMEKTVDDTIKEFDKLLKINNF